MKRSIATYLLILAIGVALGFVIGRRYCGASPKAVTIAVGNNLSSFGITETHAPMGQILSLVWQAVENPLRRSWTTYSGPPPSLSSTGTTPDPQFYRLTGTNEILQPVSPEWGAEAKRIREQSIEGCILEAKAIVLCKHSTSWGKTRCEVTRILKQVPGFEIPCSEGDPIEGHEKKVDRDVSPGGGTITFFTWSSSNPSSSLIINDGCVTDAHVDPSRPAHDPYVSREFTVEQVVKMIETANQEVDGTPHSAPSAP